MKKVLFYSLFLILYSLFFIPSVYATEWNVCAEDSGTSCSHKGAEGLQLAVNEAKDGDTIKISGKIYGPVFQPFEGRMNVNSCFVDLKGKNLTLTGGTLYGQGHETTASHKPGDANDPYYHRAGICSEGGQVTINSVRIKEFEGGGLVFFDSQVILNNNTIEGNDHGGLFLFNSSLTAVNNNFVANIGIIPFGASNIKAFNNTFYDSKAIVAVVSCNDDVPPLDFVNNIVVDTELTLGIGGLSTNCPEKVKQFENKNIKYNLLWKKERDWYGHEYQANFTGKIMADPLIDVCTEPMGLCGGSLDPQTNSPAITGGDPAIAKTMGATGGPCTQPSSSQCQNFLNNHQPAKLQEKESDDEEKIINNKDKKTGSDKSAFKGPVVLENIVLPQFLSTVDLIKFPKIGFTSDKNVKNDVFMNLFLFVIFSVVFIMLFHFAINISDFNIFLTFVYFVIGGVIGLWFNSWMMGLAISIVLSLLFI